MAPTFEQTGLLVGYPSLRCGCGLGVSVSDFAETQVVGLVLHRNEQRVLLGDLYVDGEALGNVIGFAHLHAANGRAYVVAAWEGYGGGVGAFTLHDSDALGTDPPTFVTLLRRAEGNVNYRLFDRWVGFDGRLLQALEKTYVSRPIDHGRHVGSIIDTFMVDLQLPDLSVVSERHLGRTVTDLAAEQQLGW